MESVPDRRDYSLLGEPAVYPGHPVTLAYLIVLTYPNLSAAQQFGQNSSVVEEDQLLPGAGGHNACAVRLLADLDCGDPWEEVVARADEFWASCDGQRDSVQHQQRWLDGQAQADKIKPLLQASVLEWLRIVEIEYVSLGPHVIPMAPYDHNDPYGQMKFDFGTERVEEAQRVLGDQATPETVYDYLTK